MLADLVAVLIISAPHTLHLPPAASPFNQTTVGTNHLNVGPPQSKGHLEGLLTHFPHPGWNQAEAYSWFQVEVGQQGHQGWSRLHR